VTRSGSTPASTPAPSMPGCARRRGCIRSAVRTSFSRSKARTDGASRRSPSLGLRTSISPGERGAPEGDALALWKAANEAGTGFAGGPLAAA
jgi:hypothetical protein